MTLHARSLRVLAVDLAASAATLALSACGWCLAAWRGFRRPGLEAAVAKHPAGKARPTTKHSRLIPRLVDLDAVQETFLHDQLHAFAVECGLVPLTVRAVLDLHACRESWSLPTFVPSHEETR